MNEQSTGGIRPLYNVAALDQLIREVQGRAFGQPGLAVFCGPSGFGKSYAALHAQLTMGAIYIEMRSVWNRSDIARNIMKELGREPRGTLAAMVDVISLELAQSPRPLIIDEADHLIKGRGTAMIEMVRDIYNSSDGTIILIGEEEMPRKLERWERVHGRIYRTVAAEPAGLEDLEEIKTFYAPHVDIDEALKAAIVDVCVGKVRLIAKNLSHIQSHADTTGETALSLDSYPAERLVTNRAPGPRGEF